MNILINNLNKKYLDKTILKDINLDIKNINSVGIIGSSGCGKSTLLRLLAGIEEPEPNSGNINIDNISPILNKKIFQEKIGFVFQQHNLFPHLTIQQNITIILEKIKKVSKEQALVKSNELLQDLSMLEHKDKFPYQVSGGQAQRASIARALSTNPSLIFMDEPTASLDPQLTYEVLQSIIKLKETGIDFIFVTHEMKFLKEFADYFIYINQGEIIEHGAISKLDNPETKFLQDFLEPHLR